MNEFNNTESWNTWLDDGTPVEIEAVPEITGVDVKKGDSLTARVEISYRHRFEGGEWIDGLPEAPEAADNVTDWDGGLDWDLTDAAVCSIENGPDCEACEG